MKISVKNIAQLQVGQRIQCVYPSSTGADEMRVGRVEKVLTHGVIIELANGKGYRTLNVDKIASDIEIL